MGSFLVIGMGRFGSSIAIELSRMKHEVLAVDEFEENIAEVSNQVTDVIIGDAKDETVLRSLGVQNFDCVVVATAGNIEDSILITMMLKESGVNEIICNAQNERHAKILSLLGANRVIRPEYDMGKRVAHSLGHRNLIDYLEISPDYGIIEMLTPLHWAGKSIKKNNLRIKYGVSIVAIRSAATKQMNFSPNADTMLDQGDTLTVLGSNKDLDAVSEIR
jgi:trk system potassium uptake protein TrkA